MDWILQKKWIEAFRNKTTREQIIALGVYYTYDMKLVHEKILLRGVLICGFDEVFRYSKVIIVKSLIIPQFVYIFSLLPVPKISFMS